jgi:tetratricopeptide (TPR) repeat protein
MKQLTFFVLTLLVISCNNNHSDQPAAKPDNLSAREKELRAAIAQHPDSLILTENLVQYFRENGNYDMAIAETNKAIAKDSNNPRLWDIKANLHFEDGDTSNAIHAFEKAIDIFPNPEYIMALGSIYAQTRNPQALVMADALLIGGKARADKEAIFIKGLYYTYTGDKAKAIAYFDQCMKMDYTFMLAYREKGIALYDSGKYQEALDVLEKAITVQNSYDEAYYWAGRCLEKLGRSADAVEAYKTALAYSPDYIEARDALSRLGAK